MEKKRSVQSKLLIILAIVCAVVWLFPYLYLISSSFKPGAEVVSIPAKFFPTVLSVENFTGLFERMPAFHYILNSFLVAVCSTLIAVVLGALSSYAIQRSGAKIATFLIIVVLCLKMIPTSSIAVPIYELITNLGLYDTRVALIIVYAAINMPFVMCSVSMKGFQRVLMKRLAWMELQVSRHLFESSCRSVHQVWLQPLYLRYSYLGMNFYCRCY